jgi:hypothetical protein
VKLPWNRGLFVAGKPAFCYTSTLGYYADECLFEREDSVEIAVCAVNSEKLQSPTEQNTKEFSEWDYWIHCLATQAQAG